MFVAPCISKLSILLATSGTVFKIDQIVVFSCVFKELAVGFGSPYIIGETCTPKTVTFIKDVVGVPTVSMGKIPIGNFGDKNEPTRRKK